MTLIDRTSYDSVASLYRDYDYQQAHFGAVLSGSLPGRVFADDAANPASAAILPDEGFLYLGGEPDLSFARELSEALHAGGATECVEAFYMREGWKPFLKELSPDGKSATLNRRLYRLPAASALRGRARADREDSISVDRSPDSIVARYAIGGKTVSSCSGRVYDGQAEIDIQTDEGHRRKGYGRAAALAFIAACVAGGYEPQWNCWDFREESCALAEALGFELVRVQEVFLWDKYL